ncbi:MAG: thioredoxin family protein [Candidatus Bathyarchaeia archaeon]
MSQIAKATSSNWKDLMKSEVPVVVEFYTPTCPFCRQLAPILDKLSKEYAGRLKFAMVDASMESELASGYGIMGVPTIKFFCADRPIAEMVGLRSEDELRASFEDILRRYRRCVSESSPLYA